MDVLEQKHLVGRVQRVLLGLRWHHYVRHALFNLILTRLFQRRWSGSCFQFIRLVELAMVCVEARGPETVRLDADQLLALDSELLLT